MCESGEGRSRDKDDGKRDGAHHGMENGIGYGMTATLDKAGRIVLPKNLREKLHLKPGAKFRIEVVGDKIEIELVLCHSFIDG